MADETAWQIAAEAGRVVAIKALHEKLHRRMARGDSGINLMALLLGGLTGVVQLIGEMAIPKKIDDLETIILAYVRGPLRGINGPINADGSVFETPYPDKRLKDRQGD